ncbi:MAG: hypothetical protein JXJ19_05140 [Elusimicrobia bacterium]|nr:hypothetical protein [Elusimicrobiota bacterium]
MNIKENLSIILSLAVIFCSTGLSAAETRHILIINSLDKEHYNKAGEGFKNYIAGKIGVRYSEFNLSKDKPDDITSFIQREMPDLVHTIGSTALDYAKNNIASTPVVYSMVLDQDAVRTANITGVTIDIPALTKLKEIAVIFPTRKKVGIIYSDKIDDPCAEISSGAKAYGLEVICRKIVNIKDFPVALGDISPKIDLFLMIPDPNIYFMQSVQQLLSEGINKGFGVIGLSSIYTKSGALAAFDCDYALTGNQAAEIALKILSGTKPSAIEIMHPETTILSLNLSTASKINVSVEQKYINKAIVYSD